MTNAITLFVLLFAAFAVYCSRKDVFSPEIEFLTGALSIVLTICNFFQDHIKAWIFKPQKRDDILDA